MIEHCMPRLPTGMEPTPARLLLRSTLQRCMALLSVSTPALHAVQGARAGHL